jgi:hypothetical protein
MAKNLKKGTTVVPKPQTETVAKIKAKIDEIANKSSKFKIGKTGLKLKDRLAQPDYAGYENIGLLHDSKNKELIDKLEPRLIAYAMKEHAKKCQNKDAESFGNTNDDAPKIYRVYVVFKLIPNKKPKS